MLYVSCMYVWSFVSKFSLRIWKYFFAILMTVSKETSRNKIKDEKKVKGIWDKMWFSISNPKPAQFLTKIASMSCITFYYAILFLKSHKIYIYFLLVRAYVSFCTFLLVYTTTFIFVSFTTFLLIYGKHSLLWLLKLTFSSKYT